MKDTIKKQNGVFYTNLHNPFNHKKFVKWAEKARVKEKTVLEPFAGANHIISSLQDIGLCNKFSSFDLNPQHLSVKKQDTLLNFPKGYDVCITNPPWLYKSRAKRLQLSFPDTKWDNLYKYSIEICLENCPYVAALIPASFLNSGAFLDRLDSVIVVQDRLFTDTDNPVCLAMFNANKATDTDIFVDEKYIGKLSKIKKHLPQERNNNIRFNVENGDLGLVAIDNTKRASIEFYRGSDLKGYKIQQSSRSITKISIDGVQITDSFIGRLNTTLNNMREQTYDIFMTPFKGIRADGMYRRRLDFKLARKLISEVML